MFGDVVVGVDHEHFEEAFDKLKKKYNAAQDTDVPAEGMSELCELYKQVYREHHGKPFPQDPMQQLELAIEAVFKSWMQPRAIKYRQVENITGLLGTAVNVQSMVFGNMGDDCGTGVAFTRNPSTGENKFYGEFLVNAQGEDVVAGIRTPLHVDEMPKWNKRVYKQLLEIKKTLENHYRDVQDIEFTIERGTLYMLQTRNGKRTGAAAVQDRLRHGQGEADRRSDGGKAHPGRRSDAAFAAQLRSGRQEERPKCSRPAFRPRPARQSASRRSPRPRRSSARMPANA